MKAGKSRKGRGEQETAEERGRGGKGMQGKNRRIAVEEQGSAGKGRGRAEKAGELRGVRGRAS